MAPGTFFIPHVGLRVAVERGPSQGARSASTGPRWMCPSHPFHREASASKKDGLAAPPPNKIVLPSLLVLTHNGWPGLVPHCARRMTTALSWAFREHKRPTSPPGSPISTDDTRYRTTQWGSEIEAHLLYAIVETATCEATPLERKEDDHATDPHSALNPHLHNRAHAVRGKLHTQGHDQRDHGYHFQHHRHDLRSHLVHRRRPLASRT